MLDIHRDYENFEQTRQNEMSSFAKIVIVVGCGSRENENVNFFKNLSFALKLQKQLERDVPNITNPIELKNRIYNQDLGEGAILVKVGNQKNTILQARLLGYFLGNSLAKVLLETVN